LPTTCTLTPYPYSSKRARGEATKISRGVSESSFIARRKSCGQMSAQARKTRSRIRWNTLKISSGLARHRCP